MAGNVVMRGKKFPLLLDGATRRFFRTSEGFPIWLHGDTPWSLIVQFTQAQIVTILDKRAAQGFNAIQFNAIEHHFSDQSPAYRTVEGYDPFTTMTDFGSTPVANYWNKVKFAIREARRRGMVCLMNPAYWGYGGGGEGWWSEINAEVAGDLQTYGAWLANNITDENVLWCFGGDWPGGSSADRDKQWNIVTGMRSVRTDQFITAHNTRSDSDAYSTWGPSYAGFNLNNSYTDNDVQPEAATAYSRGLPFVMIEATYEQTAVFTGPQARVESWQAAMSGACGAFYGQTPFWAGGAVIISGGAGAAATIANDMDVIGAQTLAHLASFMRSAPWWKMAPSTGTGLVTSSLFSGAGRTCPMLATDGTFAAIFTNFSSSTTVNMGAMTGLSPGIGNYANSGTQVITHPGNNAGGNSDWLMVLDQG
jgi:hypothetical protein